MSCPFCQGQHQQRFSDTALPSIRIVIPTPPAGKNSKIMRVVYGRAMQHHTRETKEQMDWIRDLAVALLRRQDPAAFAAGRPFLPTEDVGVAMVHNVRNESLDVTIENRGPRPAKGATGRRRDVHNLPELVLDALQGIFFKNDNQVCDLRVWRNIGTPTTDGERNR